MIPLAECPVEYIFRRYEHPECDDEFSAEKGKARLCGRRWYVRPDTISHRKYKREYAAEDDIECRSRVHTMTHCQGRLCSEFIDMR